MEVSGRPVGALVDWKEHRQVSIIIKFTQVMHSVLFYIEMSMVL